MVGYQIYHQNQDQSLQYSMLSEVDHWSIENSAMNQLDAGIDAGRLGHVFSVTLTLAYCSTRTMPHNPIPLHSHMSIHQSLVSSRMLQYVVGSSCPQLAVFAHWSLPRSCQTLTAS